MRQPIRTAAFAAALAAVASTLVAAGRTGRSGAERAEDSTVLRLFLAHAEEPPVEYRALRHLEAENAHFGAAASMDAWTAFNRTQGFTFDIVSERGNGYVRSRVLLGALEGERKMWTANEPQRASLTRENYTFADRPVFVGDGLAALEIKPRRKDMLLIDGRILVEPGDGELRTIEGRLSKTPSFWTRRVDIARRYERIAGVRVPVSIESVAHVLIAGRSTFKMTYEYETINGRHVGDPKPAAPSAPR